MWFPARNVISTLISEQLGLGCRRFPVPLSDSTYIKIENKKNTLLTEKYIVLCFKCEVREKKTTPLVKSLLDIPFLCPSEYLPNSFWCWKPDTRWTEHLFGKCDPSSWRRSMSGKTSREKSNASLQSIWKVVWNHFCFRQYKDYRIIRPGNGGLSCQSATGVGTTHGSNDSCPSCLINGILWNAQQIRLLLFIHLWLATVHSPHLVCSAYEKKFLMINTIVKNFPFI